MSEYSAIDPGDRWCGWAYLDDRGDVFRVRCGVLDANTMTFEQLISALLINVGDTCVIEKFQTRGIGHQHMRNPKTAQVIGALRYGVESRGSAWFEVAPDNPARVWDYPIAAHLRHWRKHWPRQSNARWSHALSAWRVLCAHLTSTNPVVLERMLRQSQQQMASPGFTEGNTLNAGLQYWYF